MKSTKHKQTKIKKGLIYSSKLIKSIQKNGQRVYLVGEVEEIIVKPKSNNELFVVVDVIKEDGKIKEFYIKRT